MAVRREQVVLDLTDNVSPGLARVAVAAGLADRAIKGMGGSSVDASRDLDKTSTSSDKVSVAARRAAPEVDRMSGRMRIMADVALTLGPALLPLGAATIPLLTASLAGLGAAAGGIGTAVLAFKGLGDGLKALDTYQAASTAENLQALRVEMEKLGPAGAEFVRFLDGLEPTLRDLQNTARAGIFPGVEDGIDDLLVRLPQVKRIVADLAAGMGDLARDAGKSLGGPDFDEFFRYIESDARPTLEAFAHSIGNVALGVANLLVAFAPLSRDFTGGLEGATKAFADWSKGLNDNKSFQSFLDYIRESGPEVVDLLGALASAVGGLAQAAGPWGKLVIPALTGVANAFAAIAKSPIGPPLFAAGAAMLAFSRASALAEKTTAKFSSTYERVGKLGIAARAGGGVGLLALSMTGLSDNIGQSNAALDAMAGLMVGGPWGAAIGTGVGLVQDWQGANDKATDSISAFNDALEESSGNVVRQQEVFDEMRRKALAAADDLDSDSFGEFFKNAFDPDVAVAFTRSAFGMKTGADQMSDAVDKAAGSFHHTQGAVGLFSTGVLDAADSVQHLSNALSGLQGWLDKRAALRDYESSLKDLSKSLKDGFGPKDVENIDAVGSNLIKVANSIKSPKLQQNFLDGAVKSLSEIQSTAGPKAQAQIQRLIDKMTELGLTHAKPTAEVVDKATPTLAQLGIKLRRTAEPVTTKVSVDPGNSLSVVEQLAHLLAGLHDRTINVTTNHIGGVTSSAGGHSAPDPTIPPPKTPSRTSALTPRRAAGSLGKMTVLGGLTMRTSGDPATRDAVNAAKARMFGDSLLRAGSAVDAAFHNLTGGAGETAGGLKALKRQLDVTQKAFDHAKKTRDDAVSRRDALSSTIQGNLAGGSIWAASTGSPWLAGAHGADNPQSAIAALNAQKDRAQRFVAALNTLKTKGVTGAALQAILSEGLEATEAMAAADLGTLSQFSTAFNDANSALAAAGLAGGNAVEGENVKQAQKAYDRMHTDLQQIKQAIDVANDDNKSAHDHSSAAFSNAVNGAASNGHRKRHH